MAPAKPDQQKSPKASVTKRVTKAVTAKADGEQRASWSTADETRLINFFIEHRTKAGDGFNFKTTTFNAASLVVNAMRTKGAPKTSRVCKNKWTQLKAVYFIVSELKNQSGFKWDEKRSADIDEDSESVWDAYVVKHPKASPYQVNSWVHFVAIQSLMPSRARGVNVFHPGNEVGSTTNGDHEDSPPLFDEMRGSSTPKDDEHIPWEKTPPPGSPTVAVLPSRVATLSLPLFLQGTKRKHSAAFSTTISEASTPTLLSTLAKKRHTSGPLALMSLSDQLSDFTEVFWAGSAAEMGSYVPSSPERKMIAMECAQELESDLDDARLVALIGLFQTDASAADAYLVLKHDGLCKAWVETKLATCTSQL